MYIQANELLEQVITPTLTALGMDSPAAEQWLLSTASQQSDLNPLYRDDGVNGNGGLGLYRISSSQHHRAWDQYLAFRPDLASRVRGLASQRQFLQNPDRELTTNLAYCTAIAWIIHLQTEIEVGPGYTGYLAEQAKGEAKVSVA